VDELEAADAIHVSNGVMTVAYPFSGTPTPHRVELDGLPPVHAMCAVDALDWLKTNFYKTELELGHCLRLPQEGPCECDLYLTCAKFVTTAQYAPRLRERLCLERQRADDARERGWEREVHRHQRVAERIHGLLAELGEPDGEP
jgi:hypothetical protein